jgi:hypothetical protein
MTLDPHPTHIRASDFFCTRLRSALESRRRLSLRRYAALARTFAIVPRLQPVAA